MKVLVTGANGQLGKAIKKESVAFSNIQLTYTDLDDFDITSEASINNGISRFKPDIIVNCAAYTAVDKAEDEPEKAFLINAEAPKLLAKHCKQNGISIIHISTDYVFDGKGNTPYTEIDKVNPLSAYGQSKLKGEENLQDYVNAMIIRTSWLYSAYGNNFLKTIIKYGKERPELRVVFDQTGTPTLANDLALAILKIASNPDKYFEKGIFHFSNQGVCSWYDFAVEIAKLAKFKAKITPITTQEYPTKATRPQYSVLNKNKISNLLNIEIPYWRDSLCKCFDELQLG
jgi:dTDP-4-dehydrorhamnose reductase